MSPIQWANFITCRQTHRSNNSTKRQFTAACDALVTPFVLQTLMLRSCFKSLATPSCAGAQQRPSQDLQSVHSCLRSSTEAPDCLHEENMHTRRVPTTLTMQQEQTGALQPDLLMLARLSDQRWPACCCNVSRLTQQPAGSPAAVVVQSTSVECMPNLQHTHKICCSLTA